MMVTLPIFMLIIMKLGHDKVLFAVLLLANVEMALVPPLRHELVCNERCRPARDVDGRYDTCRNTFFILMAMAMALIMIFPEIALWLPSIM